MQVAVYSCYCSCSHMPRPRKGCCCCCARSREGKQSGMLVCFMLSQRRARVRPCRPTRAPSHVTVHGRVWRLRCACTFTRRNCYSAGKATLKGLVVTQNKRRFQKLQGFFFGPKGRLMPPCVFQIKSMKPGTAGERMPLALRVYCVIAAIL